MALLHVLLTDSFSTITGYSIICIWCIFQCTHHVVWACSYQASQKYSTGTSLYANNDVFQRLVLTKIEMLMKWHASKYVLWKSNVREMCTHYALLWSFDRKEDPYIEEIQRKKKQPTTIQQTKSKSTLPGPWILQIAQQTRIQNTYFCIDKPFKKTIRNAKVGSTEQKFAKNSLKYLPCKIPE